MAEQRKRCAWCEKDDLYRDYHDKEWGFPVHDDRKLFEYLNLEGAQAGLSWYTVLKKKDHYFEVFDGWDAEKIALYGEEKIQALLVDPGIIRNKLKVRGTVLNAQHFLRIQKEYGSFDSYIWQFAALDANAPRPEEGKERATSPGSDAMSKALKKQGFKFVGSTICYAYMQAVGMVDDHYAYCWRAH